MIFNRHVSSLLGGTSSAFFAVIGEMKSDLFMYAMSAGVAAGTIIHLAISSYIAVDNWLAKRKNRKEQE